MKNYIFVAFAVALALRARHSPAHAKRLRAAGATPESLKLVEPSFLDEIKKSGFVERVK